MVFPLNPDPTLSDAERAEREAIRALASEGGYLYALARGINLRKRIEERRWERYEADRQSLQTCTDVKRQVEAMLAYLDSFDWPPPLDAAA